MRGIIRFPLPLLALVAALAVTGAVGGAQEVTARFPPEVEREASLLFRDVMSPFCPGMTLSTCPSPGAELMRDSLRGALAAGQTRREVLNGLRASYGPTILASPEPTGLGLVAWIGPFALLLAGGIGITVWVRRQSARPRPSSGPVAPPALDPAALAALDAALRQEP